MSRGRLASAIEAARRRARRLAAVRAPSAEDRDRLLQELDNALEELVAAGEEIQSQEDELVAATDRLEASASRYRELFHLTPLAYVVTDAEGVIREANRAAGALFRGDARALAGRPLAGAVVAADRTLFRGQLSDLRRGRVDRVEDLEVGLDTGAARITPVAVTIAALRDENGALAGLRVLLRDVRDRKQAEEAARVATAARAASDAKDEVLAALSHELRTPLNVILGWTEMLRGGGIDAEAAALALSSIERNAKGLSRLVADILDVSRLSRGELAVETRRCELHRVIADALDVTWSAAAARRIHVRVVVADAGWLLADQARLAHAIANLIANAVKFSPDGATVDIDVQRVGRTIEIRVRDEGVGIPKELLPHVFERFRQGGSSPERLSEGLGLGLSFVREVVESHGGSVSADSAGPGRGATFAIRLPLPACDEASDAGSERSAGEGPPHADPVRPQPLRGIRVLVALAPGGKGAHVSEVLARAGAEVTAAESVAEALDAAASEPPDALVVAADAARGEPAVDLARHVEERFHGMLPVVAFTPVGGWERALPELEAALQLYVAMPADPARVVPLVGAVARLGSTAPR
jgi:PAS domain S-box-containing protein